MHALIFSQKTFTLSETKWPNYWSFYSKKTIFLTQVKNMQTIMAKQTYTKGGAFLIEDSVAHQVFTPEEFSEEQQMMRAAFQEFIDQEISYRYDIVDSEKGLALIDELLGKAADLGFLGIGVPEEYGGLPMDFVTALCSNDVMAGSGSFALSIGVQTSIGIAPILLYGSEEQKEKYLPKLVTAEWKTCYCLTEPTSGSDANSGKARAILSEDGTYYTLNGQKMWITNGGIANIFIVFAKVADDKNLSAFIVEEAFGGVTRGAEEKKMGIKGSSTCQLFFNDVKVPAENMLGERGKGFKIAVNVLNTGRIKLAASGIGAAKITIGHAVNYANERIQFGQPIANYGAIKHKLGQMAAQTYGLESAVYRTGHNIDLKYKDLVAEGMSEVKAYPKSVEEFAIECAILKVYGSESQSYVADEGVQIYGGMGFSAETPVESIYRNSRINRIYEGTNEINRMLIVDMLLRKARRGQLNLLSAAQSVQKELMSIPSFGNGSMELFEEEKKVLKNLKKAVLMVAGSAVQQLKGALKSEQEILMSLADMLIHIYIAESALLRTEKLIAQTGEAANEGQLEMSRILLYQAATEVNKFGKEALYAFATGDQQRMLLMGLKRFTKVKPYNLKNARRKVAYCVIQKNKYSF